MSGHETRPEMIRRLLDALNRQEVEIAAVAERYKDKQLDEPTDDPNRVSLAYQIGDPVFMRLDPEPSPGTVTVIELHSGHVMYRVMWADIRTETTHHDFELAAWRGPKRRSK